MGRSIESNEYELYSSVSTKKVEWLWYPYIPYGKLSVMQGDPGCGKSTVIMDLIACITTGRPLPNGKVLRPHNVIYQCSEDGAADTIKPRLERAGADCRKVAYINEDLFGFSIDDEIVRNAIIGFKAKLLIIDPFQAYLGDADLSNAMSMRRILRRLSLWAYQYDCAIVLVGHLNKKSASKELYRGLGSIDVAAAARSVIQIDSDEENECSRIFKHIKSSLAPKGQDIQFEITETGTICWKCFEKEFEKEPIQYEKQILKTDKQMLIAKSIKELLANGAMDSKTVLEQLSKLHVAKRTIMSVKSTLGIESKKVNRVWYWNLPGDHKDE